MHGMQLGINEHLVRPRYASNGDSIPCTEGEEEQKVRRTANQGVALWFLVLCAREILSAAGRVPVAPLHSLHPVCHFCLPSACLFPPVRRKLYRGDRSMPTPGALQPRVEFKVFDYDRLYIFFATFLIYCLVLKVKL